MGEWRVGRGEHENKNSKKNSKEFENERNLENDQRNEVRDVQKRFDLKGKLREEAEGVEVPW